MAFVPRKSRYDPTDLEHNPWWYTTGVRNSSLRNGWEGNPFVPTYGLPNCTCYAYGRWCEIQGVWGQVPYLRGASDGGKWYANAVAQNYSVGNTPALGSIVCYGNSPIAGRVGHVAVVEEIKSNGNIVISQSGYDKNNRTPSSPTYFWTSEVTPANNYCAPWVTSAKYKYSLQGFIYLPNQPAPTTSISDYVISAMIGNFWRESTLNPNIWEGQHAPVPFDTVPMGYGLAGFTNSSSQSMYLYQMYQWVTANGYQPYDGDGQLAFIFDEKHWNANNFYGQSAYNTFDEFIASTDNDIDALTKEFCEHWEVPNSQYEALADRQQNARKALQYITDHKNDNPAIYNWLDPTTYLNVYLSDTIYIGNDPPYDQITQIQNQVMCIYFWITNGVPTPPSPEPTPGKYHKMPLWMMLHYGL